VARNNRGGRNNNPSGRNQYSWGVMEMARERPVAAAAAAAGAAAAGLFLWSKRAAINEQLSSLSDQIGEWTDSIRSNGASMWNGDETDATTTSETTGSTSSQRGMSETGGGNASLGHSSGGGGVRSNASSRGRSKGIPSTT